MRLGERIRTKRATYNMSAQSLADACGVARSYITLIENGQRLPGRKIIPKLAEALHIKTNVLINWYLEEVRSKLQ